MKPKLIKYILPILILIAGFVGMKTLVLSKAPPEKLHRKNAGILVETMKIQAVDYPVKINATGTVQPAITVKILPQVSGQVIHVNKNFEEGGFIQQGELLFKIEDMDYRLAAEKSRANIAKAEYDLASVTSQARIARREWDRIHLDDKIQPNPLVLYEPQLKNAQAALAGAKADLSQRILDIQRTKIYAPFNCRIRTKTVDIGQYITAGQNVATISGTDLAEIVVPMPLEELQWLQIPKQAVENGASAEVRLTVGNISHQWQGVVDRSMGEVDTASRMIRLIVKVNDPYGLKKTSTPGFDLAEGLFVDITIQGRSIDKVFPIPTSTLRYGETVWIMGMDKSLEIYPVKVLRREKDKILVHGPILDGSHLVTTNLSGAAQGMHLRIAKEKRS